MSGIRSLRIRVMKILMLFVMKGLDGVRLIVVKRNFFYCRFMMFEVIKLKLSVLVIIRFSKFS